LSSFGGELVVRRPRDLPFAPVVFAGVVASGPGVARSPGFPPPRPAGRSGCRAAIVKLGKMIRRKSVFCGKAG